MTTLEKNSKRKIYLPTVCPEKKEIENRIQKNPHKLFFIRFNLCQYQTVFFKRKQITIITVIKNVKTVCLYVLTIFIAF